MMEGVKQEKFSAGQILKFLVPSVLGIVLLMVPFKFGEDTTILVAFLSKRINAWLGGIVPIPVLVLAFIAVSVLLTLLYRAKKPAFIENNAFLKGIFDVNLFWTVSRVVGLVLAVLVHFKLGQEIIWSDGTGGLILNDLLMNLFAIFLIAGFLLPLLTDFGLLEYIGVFLTRVMRPVFGLPGRSSIDCIASWVGDGTIGVALTNKQYLDGYYTAREAAVIGTTFSAVSITFCFVVLEAVNLVQYFGYYYLTVTVSGIVAALILPRIPPLSWKKDTYYDGTKRDQGEDIPAGFTMKSWALHLAVKHADNSGHLLQFVVNGTKTVLDLWLGVLPIIMAFGTVTLMVAESTPLFEWLGLPFIPVLEFFRVPEAVAASRSMVVGFADMYLPAVIAEKSLESEMARFIIASLSVTQLIYMSETGAVILGSKIPVNFGELLVLFLERTLVTLPVICLFAHLYF